MELFFRNFFDVSDRFALNSFVWNNFVNAP